MEDTTWAIRRFKLEYDGLWNASVRVLSTSQQLDLYVQFLAAEVVNGFIVDHKRAVG